jgi:hypothetical protein
MSGNPYSLPIGKYEIRGVTVPLFDPNNIYNHRMPAYHRLDAGVQLKFGSRKRYKHSLNFSIYNVYARKNHIFYLYQDVLDGDLDKDVNTDSYQEKKFSIVRIYIFQFVPSFSYEFKF